MNGCIFISKGVNNDLNPEDKAEVTCSMDPEDEPEVTCYAQSLIIYALG